MVSSVSNPHQYVKDLYSWEINKRKIPRTENFQMCKLNLEKAEEPEIKFPTSVRSQEKQENFRKMSASALLSTLKPLTLDCNKLLEFLKEMEIPDHLTSLLRNLYAGQEATESEMKQCTD